MASGPQSLPRLLFGPRREGRNHGLLAASAGAEAPAAVESALRDYHLRIGDFLSDPAPVYALFPLPGGLTAAAATTRQGEVRGNRVWVTTVTLMTPQIQAGMSDLMRAFQPFPEGEPLPDAGGSLPVWTDASPVPQGAWSGEPPNEIAAAIAPDAPTAIEVAAPDSPGGFLAALSPLLRPWQRQTLSFISVPALLQPWTLVVYQAETWDAAEALGRSYRLVRLGRARYAATADGVASGAVWSQLLHALSDRAPALADRLWTLGEGVAVSDGAAALVRARATRALLRIDGAEARQEAMHSLLRAAMTLKAETSRRASLAGLYESFEDLVYQSDTPEAWVEGYLGKFAALANLEPPPPLFVPRVAMQSGALFRLGEARVRELAPPLIDRACGSFAEAVERGPDPPPAAYVILLQACLAHLAAEAGRDDVWRLARRLASTFCLADTPPAGAAEALNAFMEASLRQGRIADFATLTSPANLPGLARLIGKPALTRLLEAMDRSARTIFAGQGVRPTRETLTFALAFRRAGAMLRRAA